MTVTLCLSCSLGLLNRRPRVHSAGCWLSLLHLISIKLHRGFRGPPRSGVAFPTTSRLQLSGTLLAIQLAHRTQVSYIFVRRSLDLWYRMFNRHQAEITVMQFRGHSLPVHHSVVAQWDLSITGHWNVSLPSSASPWNSIFGPGRRSKHYTGIIFWLIKTLFEFNNSQIEVFSKIDHYITYWLSWRRG